LTLSSTPAARDRELGVVDEQALLTSLLDEVADRGQALVLRGEPSIGKSRLLSEAARERARGMTVLTAMGVQSEAHLPFAGLHQLLRPVPDRAAELPPVQRDALDAAFGSTNVPNCVRSRRPVVFSRPSEQSLVMAGARSAAEIPTLRGRRDERAVLDGLLDDARADRSGVLVLRGDAGIGKTALLEHAIESASDFTMLRAVGVESEMELPFAALHQLCAPVDEFVDRLPAPQRDALGITFGVSAGTAPDRFLVALAYLGLFSEAAQERPLLCVIDDAQWLDRASAQVLGFVARRLLAEPVVLLVAARETTDAFAGLPELLIEGLDDVEARKLLASVIPGRLDDRVADQLVAEAHGNPLALLELPRGLSPSQLAGGFGLPRALSLKSRIEQSFWHRLEELPEDTRRLFLVAAAEPTGDPGLLWRAAERLHISGPVLDAAETARLIEVDSRRVRFRHPLVRSVVYRAATPQERRLAHRALAEVTDAQFDPDRHAWHLAESTGGPDEDVAAELERAAARAQARGGWAAAAAFLERAAALTPDPSRRARRALAAAQAKYEAGSLDDALVLLRTADVAALDDLDRARVDLLRAEIAFASRRNSDAPPLLLKAARKLEAVDGSLARATYLEAIRAAGFAGRLAREADLREVSKAALAGPPPPAPPRPPDLLLQGRAIQYTEGFAAGAPIVKEALSGFRSEPDLPRRWLSLACYAAADVWDDETWRVLSERDLESARSDGALTAMPLALSVFGYVRAISGEVALAESLLDEIRAATEATGIPSHNYVALWVAALRGREDELARLVETTATDALARGEGFVLGITRQATAALNNGLGRYDVALAAVREAIDVEPSDELGSPRTMPELIEAAVRSGERRLAERALERLAQSTRAGDTDWALGLEARSRALLTDGDAADGLYREAIERLGRTRNRLQLARARLLYGEWLRRDRRRVDAREQLRTALEMFTSMGTEAFAGRAERELLATGERVRRRSVETRDELTAQEAQIARLARDGLSNAAIGERLFISQHTVAYHLRKVFAKLDITSRHELGQVLSDYQPTSP
jgi:DNA-binding CsgD family transcriptional regulator